MKDAKGHGSDSRGGVSGRATAVKGLVNMIRPWPRIKRVFGKACRCRMTSVLRRSPTGAIRERRTLRCARVSARCSICPRESGCDEGREGRVKQMYSTKSY